MLQRRTPKAPKRSYRWRYQARRSSVVPVGFKSSRLTKAEFSDLIECIYAFAAEKGIPLSDEIKEVA